MADAIKPIQEINYEKTKINRAMEHTNKIAIKILCDEYYDYAHDPECKWHYDSQYKMLVKAIELASAGKKELNTSEPHLPLGDVSRRSELLFAFARWYNPIYQDEGHGISERVIEDFIKANNCH